MFASKLYFICGFHDENQNFTQNDCIFLLTILACTIFAECLPNLSISLIRVGLKISLR